MHNISRFMSDTIQAMSQLIEMQKANSGIIKFLTICIAILFNLHSSICAELAVINVSRKIEIPLQSASSGINSGLVIAYGHPLPRPYHFEYRSDLLFVNNVQIEPSLILQREYNKNRLPISAEDQKASGQLAELEGQVRQRYFQQKDHISVPQLKAEILSMIRASHYVKDASWVNDRVLSYHPLGTYEKVLHIISFSQLHQPTNLAKTDPESIKTRYADDLVNHLKNGDCIFWGTIGPSFSPQWKCEGLKKSVRTIMDDFDLSINQKQDKLQELFNGAKEPVLDVMSNYQEGEWK